MDKTAVIVPYYNRPELLEKCLASFRKTTVRDLVTLVVVDDSIDQVDSDACFELAKKHMAIYHRNPRNLGFVGSTEIGVTLSDDPYILFLNSDVEAIKPGWLEAMLSNMADPKVGIVGAKLVFPDGHKMAGMIQHAGVATNSFGGVYHAFYGQPANLPAANVRRKIRVVTGGCLLTRRETWKEIGGWDKNFKKGVFEDVDYCREAGIRGIEVVYEPEAELTHWESASAPTLAEHPLHSKNAENYEYLNQKWQGRIERDEELFGLKPSMPTEIKLPPKLVWLWPIRNLILVKSILQAWVLGDKTEQLTIEDEMMLVGNTFKNDKHVPVMVPAVVNAAKEADFVRDLSAKGFDTQQVTKIMSILTKNDQFPKTAAPRKRHKAQNEPNLLKGIEYD